MSGAKQYKVGDVARLAGVTIRTLRHYDDIGLVKPSGHSASRYRWYDDESLKRLHQVLCYRELGFSLDDIASILQRSGDELEHLQRQHRLLLARMDQLKRLTTNVEKRMEAYMTGINLTPEEILEVFGDVDPTQHAEETRQRWGDTDTYRESVRRTSTYSKEQWQTLKAEAESVARRWIAAMQHGLPAGSPEAMDTAEAHRQHLNRWFYDCSYPMHRGLADMYLADPRFTKTHEDLAPGLAQYAHDAIHANADRHAAL